MRTLPNDRLTGPEPVRRCILSGERASPDLLVRLALSPDDLVLPDVGDKAPGRGAWLGVSRTALDTAIAKGKFRGALARAFRGATANVPEDLADRIEAALARATLDRLGLEARAGFLVTGHERIDAAARGGAVVMLLHASDGGTDGRRKLDQAWRVGLDEEGSGREGLILPVDRTTLSMALGRQNAVHVALTDDKAAERVLRHLRRWLNFIACGNPPPAGQAERAGAVAAAATDEKRRTEASE